MKECLNCTTQFQERRSTAKFCSNKCRAAFNRGASGSTITKPKLQQMFNDVLIAINTISARNGQPAASSVVFFPEKPKDASLSYNELTELISAATSGTELQKAWKEVEKNKSLASWQLRELGKLKEYQRTKLEF